MINLLTIALILSTFNEQIIEHLLGQWQNRIINKLLVYVALAMGIGEGLAFQINGITLSGLQGITAPGWVGCLATGVLIGSGSALVHKLMGTAGVGGGVKS